jgi:hypothetical protein
MMDHGDVSITVNWCARHSNGQWEGNQIHGLGVMDFSPEKHQGSDQANKVLGVSVYLTAFRTTSTIHFTNGADFPSRLHFTEDVRFYHDEGFQNWSSPMCLPSSDDLRFPRLETAEY